MAKMICRWGSRCAAVHDSSRSSHQIAAPQLGMTLIELLVVLAVLSILLSILLPAVQSARETARRAQCTSRLRNIGVAIANHVAAFQRYPPAYTSEPPRHSVITHILPFFERGVVFDEINLKLDWNHPANVAQTKQDLGEMLICPSAPGDRQSYHVTDYTCATRINYSKVARPLVKAGQIKNRGPNRYPNWHGLLQPADGPQGRKVYPENVRDGQSNTILFVEDAGRPFRFGEHGAGRSTGTDYRWANWQVSIVIDRTCRQGHMINCDNASEIYSFHVAGGNMVFADGAVRYVSQSIDPDVFVASFTAAAGDVAAAAP